mmetsp:Transcript_2331/g.6594  ORF Transcript_2331/g.6594 Transcript_2331/m.6594 type:complete len:231 (+) Transcript_2331:2929-3621(+)
MIDAVRAEVVALLRRTHGELTDLCAIRDFVGTHAALHLVIKRGVALLLAPLWGHLLEDGLVGFKDHVVLASKCACIHALLLLFLLCFELQLLILEVGGELALFLFLLLLGRTSLCLALLLLLLLALGLLLLHALAFRLLPLALLLFLPLALLRFLLDALELLRTRRRLGSRLGLGWLRHFSRGHVRLAGCGGLGGRRRLVLRVAVAGVLEIRKLIAVFAVCIGRCGACRA